MCFPSADVMNYRGDKLDTGSPDYAQAFQEGHLKFGRFQEIFQNWQTGGGFPKVPDPTVQFSQAKALQPIYQQAALGQGFTGLFKLPKPASPMGAGVPYSVPPVSPIGGK